MYKMNITAIVSEVENSSNTTIFWVVVACIVLFVLVPVFNAFHVLMKIMYGVGSCVGCLCRCGSNCGSRSKPGYTECG